jgi:ATP-dependent DNA ligase
VLDYLDRCIEAGYEGAMIRKDDYWYEEGKRSASLYKAKKYLDSEFIVRDITASKDSRGSWAILHCDGFTVSAPGTMQQKIKILENMNEYIGKKLTVKYYGLTKAGIPVFPVALHWRDDL